MMSDGLTNLVFRCSNTGGAEQWNTSQKPEHSLGAPSVPFSLKALISKEMQTVPHGTAGGTEAEQKAEKVFQGGGTKSGGAEHFFSGETTKENSSSCPDCAGCRLLQHTAILQNRIVMLTAKTEGWNDQSWSGV